MSAIIKAPPHTLAPAATTQDARAQLAAARERLLQKLAVVEKSVEPLANWRVAVKRHPVLTIGGAFLVGYAIARLFSRK